MQTQAPRACHNLRSIRRTFASRRFSEQASPRARSLLRGICTVRAAHVGCAPVGNEFVVTIDRTVEESRACNLNSSTGHSTIHRRESTTRISEFSVRDREDTRAILSRDLHRSSRHTAGNCSMTLNRIVPRNTDQSDET